VHACRFNQTLRPSIIQNETESSRIAFGTSASKNLIPFAVYLEIKENGPGYVTCGGSLITPHVVVTAAHCLFSDTGKPAARSVNIFTGSNDLYYSRVYKGYSYVKPSAYAPAINDKLDGDIALIYIKSAVTGIKPVALDGGRYAKQGRWYITAGWGKTQSGKDSDVLKWVAVPKVTTSQFQQVRQQLYASTGTGMPPIETDHMAAGLGSNGGDSCVGDSGGPLFTPGPSFTNSEANQNVLVGIVSYGPSAKCGGSLNLGVYTKVSYWKQWIKNTIAENNWTK